jgi:hypothetical protein
MAEVGYRRIPRDTRPTRIFDTLLLSQLSLPGLEVSEICSQSSA